LIFYTCVKKFLTEIEHSVRNGNVCQKSEFLSKIGIFVKARIFSKIEFFVKNRNCCEKSNFLSKIEIVVKNRIFCQKSKFWLRNWNSHFRQKNGSLTKFWYLNFNYTLIAFQDCSWTSISRSRPLPIQLQYSGLNFCLNSIIGAGPQNLAFTKNSVQE